MTLPKLGYYAKDALVILVISLTVLYAFMPLLADPAARAVDDYDGLFIAWQHAQISEKLWVLDWRHFFDGRIFYPNPQTLAFSEPFITDSVLSMPLWLLTHEPVALLTFHTLLAQLLTLVMVYFLLHELTNDRRLALALTLVFGYSPLRLLYIGHLQQFQIAGVILAWLAIVKLVQQPSRRWLALFFGSFLLQFYNSFLTAWFILFSSVIYLILEPVLRRHLRLLRREITFGCILTGLLMLPLLIPYIQVSRFYQYIRPLTDVIHFSLSPEQVVTTFNSPLLWGVILFGLILMWFQKRNRDAKIWFLIGGASFVMSLGPALHWLGQTVKIPFHIPLPYLVFYYLVPGFQGFRTPSRWLLLAGLAMTVGSSVVLSRLPKKWRGLIAAGLIMLSMIGLKQIQVMAVPARAEYPAVYAWLKDQSGKVLIELPIFRWGSDNFSKNEVYRMIYQTEHGKALVNGYSGFSPPEWETLVARIQKEFPGKEMIAELKKLGVDYLIIHQDEYRRFKGAEINLDPVADQLELQYQEGDTLVYKLKR